MTKSKQEPTDYFYVSYYGPSAAPGFTVLAQNRPPGGGENPDGFNLATACRILSTLLNGPVVIISWIPITELRYLQLHEFLEEIVKSATEAPKPKNEEIDLTNVIPLNREPS